MSDTQLLMRRPNLTGLPQISNLPAGLALSECDERDAVGLARLLADAFQDPTWTVDRVHTALLDAPDVIATFTVKSDTALIATASARYVPDRFPNAGYVHWVAADPARKGQGLGRIVSLAVLHRFVALGYHDAYLQTDDSRLPAIATYLGLGFEPVLIDHQHEERWAAVRAALAISSTAPPVVLPLV